MNCHLPLFSQGPCTSINSVNTCAAFHMASKSSVVQYKCLFFLPSEPLQSTKILGYTFLSTFFIEFHRPLPPGKSFNRNQILRIWQLSHPTPLHPHQILQKINKGSGLLFPSSTCSHLMPTVHDSWMNSILYLSMITLPKWLITIITIMMSTSSLILLAIITFRHTLHV